MTSLDKIVPLIAKVVDGNDLTAKEAEEAFTTIFLHDREGFHYSILISAIHAKGETSDELLGLISVHNKLGIKLKPNILVDKTTDLSGSGGGIIKTINVSTTASFIVAAAGYKVLKNAYWAITSFTGSADIFDEFGVSVAKLTRKKIKKSLEQVGISPIYFPLISPKLKNRGNLSRQFFIKNKFRVKTPFHLINNVITPIPMKYRIYGLYSDKYLETVGELFAKLGYKKTLTFYGEPGLPEISNVGKTTFIEQNSKSLKRYSLTPRDLGVKKATIKQIQTGGKKQNIIDFLRILMGKEKGAKSDLVAINAAASLYVLGETKSIRDSVPKAQRIIKEGEGFRVLKKLVKHYGNSQLLQKWLKEI